MTDISQPVANALLSTQKAAELRRIRRDKRFAAETRFRMLGLVAIFVAGAFLVILMSTIVGKSIPAFTQNYVSLPVDLSFIDPADPKKGKYDKAIKNAMVDVFPFVKKRKDKKLVRGLISSGAGTELRKLAVANVEELTSQNEVEIILSDFADLYAKGLIADGETTEPDTDISVEQDENLVTFVAGKPVFASFLDLINVTIDEELALLDQRMNSIGRSLVAAKDELANAAPENTAEIEARISDLEAKLETHKTELDVFLTRKDNKETVEKLDTSMPSLMVGFAGGVVKATSISSNKFEGEVIIPFSSTGKFSAGEWQLKQIPVAEDNRKFTDKEAAYMDYLTLNGKVASSWNSLFFSNGASREPEMAGIWGAVVGSFYTMVVTLLLSFPLGVAAAIYLEEFAPKNKLTDIIEVNINNLAAVPSIVFGLLGLAIFLNGVHLNFFGFFEINIGGGFRRSAAFVGGMVLALMTLPTIIIASRAALKSVPPSIREAAFGIGASRLQAAFHHTLPLAIPGILTGTIIGMARALGETAPLLMIGMVAFIVDIPQWFDEPATVLPVQIYMWADFPEQAFQHKNAAAILVLLVFLVLMNAVAVLLRRRFERRW